MAKCLAKDRHDQPCRFKSLADSRFCKNHQYMNDYTDEMLAATIRCNGCMKHYYLQKGNKNCDKCKERGKKNREKKGKFKPEDKEALIRRYQLEEIQAEVLALM